ncbi:MAG: hypothetical protein JNM10_04155 [Planctomycetia bacterium]|nr:hypothetical protein [Planctomycetia bacterium]
MQSIVIGPRTSSTRRARAARVFRSAAPTGGPSLGVFGVWVTFAVGAMVGGVVAHFGGPAEVAGRSMAAVVLGALLFAGRDVLASLVHDTRRDVRRFAVLYLRWAGSHRGAGFR